MGVDAPVVVGGIIPEEDRPRLAAAGVAAVYTPKDFDIVADHGRDRRPGDRAHRRALSSSRATMSSNVARGAWRTVDLVAVLRCTIAGLGNENVVENGTK